MASHKSVTDLQFDREEYDYNQIEKHSLLLNIWVTSHVTLHIIYVSSICQYSSTPIAVHTYNIICRFINMYIVLARGHDDNKLRIHTNFLYVPYWFLSAAMGSLWISDSRNISKEIKRYIRTFYFYFIYEEFWLIRTSNRSLMCVCYFVWAYFEVNTISCFQFSK